MDEQYSRYIWLAIAAFAGGIIGYFRKQAMKDMNRTLCGKLRSAALSVGTSMFVAWVTYEIALYFVEHVNVCVALAGLASFLGTDLLVACEEGILSGIGKFIKKTMKVE